MTTLEAIDLVLPAADLGPENPLPPLRSLQQVGTVSNVDELPADLADGVGYGRLGSPLPHLLQDGYDRDRRDRALPALVLDNGVLRATVLPGLGGRLHSLVHDGRELLHRNPVFQPANLALRDAWFAGGVEWNLGSTGHTTLTCAPLHAAEVTGPDGSPVLRLWEFERTRELVYQLDFWLPPGSAFLFVGARVTNPHDHETPAYWWSNIAVPQTPGGRVLAPATRAWHYGYSGRLDDIPVTTELTYPMRAVDAADYFFEIPPGQLRWIAALDEDGSGLVQCSTERLRGRKLFVWGESPGGRRWQDWLAPGVAGHGYAEIQAGLARTQLEHLRLPARTSWDWLEAYGPLRADPADVHAADWDTAWRGVDEALAGALSADELRARFAAWRTVADRAPGERLHRGSGWGALEFARAGRPAPLGTPFDTDLLGPEQRRWLALLDGAVPLVEPTEPPGGTLVSPAWADALAAAPETWLTAYHLGVARWYHDDRDGAVAAWTRSHELAANPWALRNLAVATGRAELLRQAHELAPDVPALALEATRALLAAGLPDQAARVLDQARLTSGRARLLRIRVLLAQGDPAAARAVFDEHFEVHDLREGETELTDAWREVQRQLGTAEPLPAHYDFRMVREAE